jgi:transcription-repair coupling factor (superfamily II helicase)
LVIIDEEQRFGVAHKERLKRLRTQVDVLTLSATPIPRTLQLGMVGLREISVISTPPADRLAIRTFVCVFDAAFVAEVIRREVSRGGQVFFVHNRVEDIEQWAARITAIVPELRIAVGHGQMEPAALESVMLRFVAGEFDVLVCTTIIEAGLDIPRANTMLINRADQFGLSQLYQIRGRIGRSTVRAYCYLLVPPRLQRATKRERGDEEDVTDAREAAHKNEGGEEMGTDGKRRTGASQRALERLAALQQYSQLGSGFSIASYELRFGIAWCGRLARGQTIGTYRRGGLRNLRGNVEGGSRRNARRRDFARNRSRDYGSCSRLHSR